VLAGGTDRPENEYIQYMVFMGIPGLVMYMGALISMMICQLKKIKKMELITIASAGCALAYAAGACFGNSMYYTTPYFYMFLGMTARTIKLENTK
jgi:O-antigen ligase